MSFNLVVLEKLTAQRLAHPYTPRKHATPGQVVIDTALRQTLHSPAVEPVVRNHVSASSSCCYNKCLLIDRTFQQAAACCDHTR